MADKKLRVIVTADNKDLEKKLKQADKSVQEFAKKTEKVGKAGGADFGGAFTVAAGAALAKLGTDAIQFVVRSVKEYDRVLDSLKYQTANAGSVTQSFYNANVMTAASLDSVATAAQVVTGRLGRSGSEVDTFIARLAKWQEEAGFTGAAMQNMATIAQRFNMTSQLGTSFGYVKAAAEDTAFTIDQISAAMVDAAPLSQHLGYSLSELAYITQKLGKNGVLVSEWSSIMGRQLEKFGYDAGLARKDWESFIKSLSDPNYKGNKMALLSEYGFEGNRALNMLKAVQSGAFNGGTLGASALPGLTPEDLGDIGGLAGKALSQAAATFVDNLFQLIKDSWNSKVLGQGAGLPSMDIQMTDEWQTWLDLMTKGLKPGESVDWNNVQYPRTMDELNKAIDALKPKKSSMFQIAPAFQSASAFSSDTGGSDWVFAAIAGEKAQMKLVDNAQVVAAEWQETGSAITRSFDYNMGAVRQVVGETAGVIKNDAVKSVYNLKTAFGTLEVDITNVQKALNEWGISLPTLWDNVLEGASRMGWELLEELGLPYTKQEVESFMKDMGGILKAYGADMESFWVDLTDGVKTSTEEIGMQALGNLKELAGGVLMTMSDMFATGKWDWERLWKQIWKGLLGIAIDYGLKIIANSELMMAAVQAIEAFVAGLQGNWVKVALITAGVAAAIGATAAIVAKIKQGNEGADISPSSMPTAYPSSYGPSASGGGTIIINNPSFYGQIDDRSAQALGEGMIAAQSRRGITPLAFA